MRKKRLLWQLYPSYLLITLIALLAVTWCASSLIHQFYIGGKADDLEARAHLIENQILQNLNPSNFNRIDHLCKLLGKRAATRFTVILPDGLVIGDSDEEPAKMENHLNRPEIQGALIMQRGISSRYSSTVKKNMLYVAFPLTDGDKIIGFLRTSMPMTLIEQTLKSIQRKIVFAVVIIALLASIIGLVVSWRISRPLEEMKNGVEKFSGGDLSYRLPVPDTEEMSKLAEALNKMANQLDEKVKTIMQQRNEQKAVLQSMVEGVLAVDKEERLLNMNKAAAKLFRLDADEAHNRSIQEIIRNTKLQHFISRTLVSNEPIESEFMFWDRDEHFLRVSGSALKDEQEKTIGALIVLNDITRLRRLENLRRDFVANVSHEIKTPLTSIKGFVETLLDGVTGDTQTAKHLRIIAKQANHLDAIIEDLLCLARLEKAEEKSKVILEEKSIQEALESAIEACLAKAAENDIKISLSCEKYIKAKINSHLLEQALVNLVDNAIKYSEPKKDIHVIAEKLNGKVTISVSDQGCGIEKEHLTRIFERFYRVDKARSRKQGGTGLGLAIVKHIVQVHQGNVTVESTPGVGSTFRLHLAF